MDYQRAPEWMRKSEILDDHCKDCGDHMRWAEKQLFCLRCWCWRTKIFEERARHSLALLEKRQREEAENIQHDETGGYLHYADKAAQDQDWQGVLAWKWRVAVLELTGKRLPMTQGFDA